MEKGDDELAKEALKRRKSNQENADTMKAQLDQQRTAVNQLISNTKCVRRRAWQLLTPYVYPVCCEPSKYLSRSCVISVGVHMGEAVYTQI